MQTLLREANTAFRDQNYEEALRCYELALHTCPSVLKSTLEFNRKLAENHLRARHGTDAVSLLNQIQAIARLEGEVNFVTPYFDTAFYLGHNADVAQAAVDPIEHYCGTGWREGRDPHPEFSTQYYLEMNPDVQEADINPYWHYLTAGKSEGRRSCQVLNSETQETEINDTESVNAFESHESTDNVDWKRIAKVIKSNFDSNFYLSKYADVKASGINPLKHYCLNGWKERRDPCPDFSTAYYLDANQDVADAGINPFWHYVVAGKAEGRVALHPGGYKAETLKSLPALEQMVIQWKKHEPVPESLSAEMVALLITQGKSTAINQLAISIGHDHYRKVSGGVQLCIQREERVAAESGILYLNVHPWQPLPKLANQTDESDPLLCLVLAGRDAGVCHASALTRAVGQIAPQFHDNVHVIIHSLLGHSIERVKDLVNLANDRRCWFWLHDFFSLCPSYALQRNNVSFCGAPDLESNACAICVFGDERRSHLRRVHSFFEEVEVTVISPSEVTRQFWASKAKMPMEQVFVMPHLEMQWIDRERVLEIQKNLPISIGFLGAPVYHKGWQTYETLVKALANDSRFRFVYFGAHTPPLSGIECVNVHVTIDDEFAMTRAISESQVDFVLHWATWPETFSFTAHEAIAAGAYILTNPISGNVAATVSQTGMGAVLENEQALVAFLQEGAASQMVTMSRAARTTQYCQSRFSDMTLPLFVNEEVA